MKKLILSLLLAAMLAVPMGTVALAQNTQDPAAVTEEVQGAVPAQSDPAQAMHPAVHALVLAMTENDLDYDPSDSQFLWTSLYYMLSLYGQLDERAEFTDDTLILPSEVVQDFAAALYPDVSGLPAIPAPISERISYHAGDDTYRLARGDEGLAEVVIRSTRQASGGGLTMEGALASLEDGSTLRSFRVALLPRDSMFGYQITNLTFTG